MDHIYENRFFWECRYLVAVTLNDLNLVSMGVLHNHPCSDSPYQLAVKGGMGYLSFDRLYLS